MKAMIVGVSGLVLTLEELDFIAAHQPWGFILFARNIDTREQVLALTDALRQASGREDVCIFIDQEGGRVQRLRPPLCENYPTAAHLGKIYHHDSDKAIKAAWLMSRLHAFDLRKFGINANCLPLLDVPIKGAHDVIGDRAYGYKPQIVIDMGKAAAQGLLAGGVLPVMKHIPGHGRAFADTHLELAKVDAALELLQSHDFAPFKALSHLPVAMTAHVVYEAIDPQFPATLSKKTINTIIRHHMNFDGLLMSDDLSMKALEGDFADLTAKALSAGCDIVLHCNGNMQEMQAIAKACLPLQDKALQRAEKAQHSIETSDLSEESAIRAQFAEILAEYT